MGDAFEGDLAATEASESGAGNRAQRHGSWATTAAVALAVLVVAEVGARAVADRLPPRQVWGTAEAQYKADQIDGASDRGVDVVFAGTSVVDAGVDPTAFDRRLVTGRGSYNAALGAGSPAMVRSFTSLLAVPRLRPTLLVLGISSRDLNANDPGQASLERQWFASPAVAHLTGTENLVDTIDRVLSDHSALVAHRAELRSPRNLAGRGNPAWGEALTQGDGQYTAFLDQHFELSARQVEFVRSVPLHDWAVDEAKVGAFRSVIEGAMSTGAAVLLVDMPTTAAYRELHPNGSSDVEIYERTVEALATSTGVPLIRLGAWPDDAFADVLHLNAVGSERLTHLLVQEVAERWPEVGRLRT